MTDTEKTLRKLLWLRHGCPFNALYGDDGEMQCSACGIDFGRDDPDRMESVWIRAALPAIAAAMEDYTKQQETEHETNGYG